MIALTEKRVNRILAWIWMFGFFAFLMGPLFVVAGASFGENPRGLLLFPPAALTTKWYASIEGGYWAALLASVLLASVSVVFSVLLGVPAALGLVRTDLLAKPLVAAALRAPVQIPAVVAGVAFLQFYYILGDALGWYGGGTWSGLLIAHAFIGTPYVVGSVTAVVQRFNVRLEEAALSLGASRWSTFRRVTLPVILPGVYSGATYAFLVSFSDLPIALFLSSSEVRTFPVVLFQAMDYDFDPSLLAVSTIIIALSFVAMLVLQRAIGLGSLLRTGK
jgi:putative spermidine/putrescine transport system permease protein